MAGVTVYLGGRRLGLDPSMALGKGGEADVYDLGDGRCLKLFKRPGHPDLKGLPVEQKAAADRLALHQTKLAEFPTGLPERVVGPDQIATDRRGAVVGYAMRRIDGAELLYRYADPGFRRGGAQPGAVVGLLRDLRATVAALHGRDVVIGDFNDLNVLVAGDRAYLIDADSFQFGRYLCAVFSERFVDPLLCDPAGAAPVLGRPHNRDSDWYAFAVMTMRSLLWVGPYGGVYRPSNRRRRIAHAARPLRRITVFDPQVVYPKPAIPYRVLPDELLHHLHQVFVEDVRGEPPVALLDGLRWTRCSACGGQHARPICPHCAGGPRIERRAAVRMRGEVTAETLFTTPGEIVDARVSGGRLCWLYREGGVVRRDDGSEVAGAERGAPRLAGDRVALARGDEIELIGPGGGTELVRVDRCGGRPAFGASARHRYWVAGGQLLRDGRWGAEPVGDVLARQTRFWVGDSFGLGFYHAGSLAVAFVFADDRPRLDDRVALPPPRGGLIDAHCVFADDRAWLFTTEKIVGQLVTRCLLLDRTGRALAAAERGAGDGSWLHAGHTACALGRFLFVATDDGVVRIEQDGDALAVTRNFPDTEPFVDTTCRLLVGAGGMFAVARDRIVRLTLSPKGATS